MQTVAIHLKGMSSPYIARAELRARDKIVEQMADDMAVIETRRGFVDRDDLELLGWLQQQINLYAADARRLAQKKAIRSVRR